MSYRAPPIRNFVALDVTPSIQLALVRTDIDPVFIHLTLSDSYPLEIDKHRSAILWIDDDVGLDMCNLKFTGKIYSDSMPGRVFYSSDERTVLGVIWHGISQQGTGLIGRIIACGSLRLRVYFSNHTQENFDVDHDSLRNWKDNITQSFLSNS